jgi:hypothetical protein
MSTLVGERYLNDFIRKQERHDVMAHDASTCALEIYIADYVEFLGSSGIALTAVAAVPISVPCRGSDCRASFHGLVSCFKEFV